MKKVEIFCDNCERDITYTGNSVDWRVSLVNERIPPNDGCVTDMHIYPILDEDMHFCSHMCLVDGVNNIFNKKATNE